MDATDLWREKAEGILAMTRQKVVIDRLARPDGMTVLGVEYPKVGIFPIVHDDWSKKLDLRPSWDPISIYGFSDKAIGELDSVASRIGWGSVAVLSGLSDAALKKAEVILGEHSFQPWLDGKNTPGLLPDARVWVKQDMSDTGYGTHLPILLEAVQRTSGPVLELGAGEHSTPALHAACSEAGRLVVTVDGDEKWLDHFRHERKMLDLHHQFHYAPDPAETEQLCVIDWSVVFVDHAPGESRRRAVERAADRAEMIVVHDSEELSYQLEPVLSGFRFRYDHRRYRPWTSVVSNMVEWK